VELTKRERSAVSKTKVETGGNFKITSASAARTFSPSYPIKLGLPDRVNTPDYCKLL
jgi:hypothetical protein